MRLILRWHPLQKRFNCLKTNLRHKSGSWQTPLLSGHLLRWQIELKLLKQVIKLSSRNTLCGQKKRHIVQNSHYALHSHFIRWERCITASLLRKKLIKILRINTSGYWSMYLKLSDSNKVQHNLFSLTIPWLRLLSTLIMLSIVHYSLSTMNLWTLC